MSDDAEQDWNKVERLHLAGQIAPVLREGAAKAKSRRVARVDADGKVIGAVGFVLYDDPRHLAPVVSRYQRLRTDLATAERKLADARRAASPTTSSSASDRLRASAGETPPMRSGIITFSSAVNSRRR